MTKCRFTEDELIDRADRGVPHESPEEAEARRPWDRLNVRLRALSDVPVPPLPEGWEDRAVQRWQNRRRGIALAIGVSVLLWVAIAVLLLR